MSTVNKLEKNKVQLVVQNTWCSLSYTKMNVAYWLVHFIQWGHICSWV